MTKALFFPRHPIGKVLACAMLAIWLNLPMPSAAQDAAPAPQGSSSQATETAIEEASSAAKKSEPKTSQKKECLANIGCVTNLPLPRYVSLKGDEGNARRGPGLTHRIDWVFTRPGMPLRVTAEYENWRRIEDQDGAGGWVHYALLSGVRTVLFTTDMAEIFNAPNPSGQVVAQAELGVVARISECEANWCRLSIGRVKGWAKKADLWGVDAGEIVN